MHKSRVIVIVLLGAMAVAARTIQPNAPFIWVGRSDVGSIVWSMEDISIPLELQSPIPYMALGLAIPVNVADAGTLASIPGLGPVKSAALVEYRRTHGCFSQMKDLSAVRGIGPKTVLKVAPSMPPAPKY